ncbi:MAG: response regulator [Chitinophagales bacterium]
MDIKRTILLVEDDMVDIMTIKQAVRELQIENPLIVTQSVEEGAKYLETCRENLPFIILLNINMPRMNGVEFLKVIKQDKRLRAIPIIILTTSKEQQDRYEGLHLGVAGYMVKPIHYQEFLDLLKMINAYWIQSEMP